MKQLELFEESLGRPVNQEPYLDGGKDFFIKHCIDCQDGKKCYGYKLGVGYGEGDYNCKICDPNCLIINDKNAKVIKGFCPTHFVKRQEQIRNIAR